MSSIKVLKSVSETPQSSKTRRVSEQVQKLSAFKLGLREKIRRTKSVPDELTCLETPKKPSGSEFSKKKGKNERSKASRASSSAHVQYVVLRTVILDNDAAQLAGLIDRRDVNVNYMDPDGLYPIHYAAKGGNVDILQILMDAGADLNALSKRGEYPLDFAVKEGNFDVARFLIEKGARQNNIVDGFRGDKSNQFKTSRKDPPK